jgi:Flp pilus assembly protein TadD
MALRAQNFQPEAASVQDTLGWVHFRRGSLDEAGRALRAALAKAPDVPEVNYHLGMVLLKAGEKEQARPLLQKAVVANWDAAGRRSAEEALRSI